MTYHVLSYLIKFEFEMKMESKVTYHLLSYLFFMEMTYHVLSYLIKFELEMT